MRSRESEAMISRGLGWGGFAYLLSVIALFFAACGLIGPLEAFIHHSWWELFWLPGGAVGFLAFAYLSSICDQKGAKRIDEGFKIP